MNKVSVVMITYGHEKYISEAINGILKQKYDGEIELIIANDNSPDNSDYVIKNTISNVDKNITIKYTKHDVNLGMMQNFFWAINQATGDFIALCEGDDFWIDPSKIKKQVDFLKNNPDFGLTFTDVNFVNEDGEIINKSVFSTNLLPFYNDPRIFLIKRLYYSPCTWLGRKEFFKLDWRNNNIADGTFAMMIEILSKTNVHLILETTANYRLLNESASRTTSLRKAFNREIGLFLTQKHYINHFDFQDIKEKVNQSCTTSIAYLLAKNNKNSEFLQVLKLINQVPELREIRKQIRKWLYILLKPIQFSFKERLIIAKILKTDRISKNALFQFVFKK